MSHKPRNAAEYLDEPVIDPVSEALDKLDTKLYSVEQGVIRPLTNHKMTQEEWEAIVYLQDEWTFFYEPEADLVIAACEYERARENVSDEVYSWEG